MPDLVPSRFRSPAPNPITVGAGCGCTGGAAPAAGPAEPETPPRTLDGVGVVTFLGLPPDWTVTLHPWPASAAAPESALDLDPRTQKVPAGHYVVRARAPSGEVREAETTVAPDTETQVDFTAAHVTHPADTPPAPPPPPARRAVAEVIVTGAPAGTRLVLARAEGVHAVGRVPFVERSGVLIAEASDTGRWLIIDPDMRVDSGVYVYHPLSLDSGTRTEVPFATLLRTPGLPHPPPDHTDPVTGEHQRPPPSGTDKVLVGITLAATALAAWAVLDRPAAPRENPHRARRAARRNARRRGR